MDSTCEHCGRDYSVRDGCDPTPLCDECAHAEVERLRGGWVDAKETLPAYLTPVLLLNVNRYMAFDPHGNWKGVGVLAGEETTQPYWSVIGETGGLILGTVTHWMPIPENPPNRP